MKKSELIRELEKLSGDPEVVLWNGIAEDWMPISTVGCVRLTKPTKSRFSATLKLEAMERSQTLPTEKEVDTAYRQLDWRVLGPVFSGPVEGRNKSVIMLQASLRGKSMWDRLGTVRY